MRSFSYVIIFNKFCEKQCIVVVFGLNDCVWDYQSNIWENLIDGNSMIIQALHKFLIFQMVEYL